MLVIASICSKKYLCGHVVFMRFTCDGTSVIMLGPVKLANTNNNQYYILHRIILTVNTGGSRVENFHGWATCGQLVTGGAHVDGRDFP